MKRPVNFRDLGGIPAANGKKVREKKILRSGEINNLTDEERRNLLEEYELKTVIDLRSDGERERSPNDDLPVRTVHLDIIRMDVNKSASMKGLSSMKTVEDVHKHMSDLYRAFVEQEVPRECYHEFVQTFLEQEEGSVIFHCYAGKDRTGMGAAIILALLGVSEEEIMKDYLITNELRREANEAICDERRAKGDSEEAVEAYRYAMSVHEDFLRATFAAANESYGSFYAYCTSGLNISEEQVVALREKYLA